MKTSHQLRIAEAVYLEALKVRGLLGNNPPDLDDFSNSKDWIAALEDFRSEFYDAAYLAEEAARSFDTHFTGAIFDSDQALISDD